MAQVSDSKSLQGPCFTWTNEGAINGNEAIFLHLALRLSYGDLYGSLTSPQFEESYDVHVHPGWFHSVAYISLLRGRGSMPVAKVTLKLRGNRNRLAWKLTEQIEMAFLPSTTELWPIAEPQAGAA